MKNRSQLQKDVDLCIDAAQKSIGCIIDEGDEEELMAATEKVNSRPAIDSGSVSNVLNPTDLPCAVEAKPNTSGRHFAGANNSRIEKYGSCTTRLESEHGEVACDWELADVTRPLHSVSQIAGPRDGPGKFDVLFNNKRCIVVPPGVVEQIARRLQGRIQAEYPREGNLYVGDMTISGFGRQGTQE